MADDINNQYGLPDLGQLVSGRTHFPPNPQAAESYLFHRNHQHETIMLPGGLVRFGHDHHHNNFSGANISCNTSVSGAAASGSAHSSRYGGGVDMESGGWSFGNEGGNCRWPRQETLTLLEIRSRLDSKFKEANQKKPLWDEVSRYTKTHLLFYVFDVFLSFKFLIFHPKFPILVFVCSPSIQLQWTVMMTKIDF